MPPGPPLENPTPRPCSENQYYFRGLPRLCVFSLATTNVKRLGSVKNCMSINMVIVGPYLTYHDHLVEKGRFKTYSYIRHICLASEVKVVKRDYILTLLCILYTTLLHGQFFTLPLKYSQGS